MEEKSKFINRQGAVYMLVAELKDGKVDFADVIAKDLPMEDWQSLVEAALQPEPCRESQGLVDRQGMADLLSCSATMVDRCVEKGMPCVDLAEESSGKRCLRFDPADCTAWLKRNMAPAGGKGAAGAEDPAAQPGQAFSPVAQEGTVNKIDDKPTQKEEPCAVKSCTNCKIARACCDYDFDNPEEYARKCGRWQPLEPANRKGDAK